MKSKELIILLKQLEELKASIAKLQSADPEEVLLTSDQMEKLLKCSTSTLYRWRKKGAIPCVQIGGQYRYPKNFFTKEVINSITRNVDNSKRFDDE